MIPVEFPEQMGVLAEDQKEYLPLPFELNDFGEYGTHCFITCWRLSWWERFRLLFSGRVWLSQLTFGRSFQPQRPGVRRVDVLARISDESDDVEITINDS